MGLEFVGGTAAYYLSDGTTNVSLTSLTGGLASQPAAGDIVVVFYSFYATSNVDLSISGYTELADLYADDSNKSNVGVYWKIMGGTPDTVLTMPAATTNHAAVAVHVWRGVDQTTPIDVTTTTATGLDTCIPNPPAITPTTPGAVILAGGGTYVSAPKSYTTNGMDNFFETTDTAGTTSTVFIASYSDWVSGSFNPDPPGITSDANGSGWCAASVVLRPAT